jgi:hypothetical protein
MGVHDGWRSGARPRSNSEGCRSANGIAILSRLQNNYRAALSGAVVAKAYYLSKVGERSATVAGCECAKEKWERMETRRRRLAEQIEKRRQLMLVEKPSAGISNPQGSNRPKNSKALPNATLELPL